MKHRILILDSNDDGSLEVIVNKFSKIALFYNNTKKINKELRSLGSILFFKKKYLYLFMHINDVEERLAQVKKWAKSNNTTLILYSGGATGKNGVYQRSEVRRKLEVFILHVQSNDNNPMKVFNSKMPKIDYFVI